MQKQLKWLAVVTLALSTPAIAGEVTGRGEDTPIRSGVASSICAFSGQNDDGAGPNSQVQAYGAFIAAFGPGHFPSPGIACRGN